MGAYRLLGLMFAAGYVDRHTTPTYSPWLHRSAIVTLIVGVAMLFFLPIGGVMMLFVSAFAWLAHWVNMKQHGRMATALFLAFIAGCFGLVMWGSGPPKGAVVPELTEHARTVLAKKHAAAPSKEERHSAPAGSSASEPRPAVAAATMALSEGSPDRTFFVDHSKRVFHDPDCTEATGLRIARETFVKWQRYTAHSCVKNSPAPEKRIRITQTGPAQTAATPPPAYAPLYSGDGASGSSTSSGSSGGTVHVKGYTRADGTYVPPHTRRRAKR